MKSPIPGTSAQVNPRVGPVELTVQPDGRALKHVQVREYVRSLVDGAAPGTPAHG
jgi:GntR family transcriptional regulator